MMANETELTKNEKAVLGCLLFIGLILLLMILAAFGTGLYLAVHNWG